jgi:hypothetical protein
MHTCRTRQDVKHNQNNRTENGAGILLNTHHCVRNLTNEVLHLFVGILKAADDLVFFLSWVSGPGGLVDPEVVKRLLELVLFLLMELVSMQVEFWSSRRRVKFTSWTRHDSLRADHYAINAICGEGTAWIGEWGGEKEPPPALSGDPREGSSDFPKVSRGSNTRDDPCECPCEGPTHAMTLASALARAPRPSQGCQRPSGGKCLSLCFPGCCY